MALLGYVCQQGLGVTTGGSCGTTGVRVSTGGSCGTTGVRVSTGGSCGIAGVRVSTGGRCGTAGGHIGGIVVVAGRVAIGTGWEAAVVLMCFSDLCSNIVNASFKASASFSRYPSSLDCKVYIKFMLTALPKLLVQIKLPNLMMFSHYCTRPHVQVLHLETFLMIHHWNTSNPNVVPLRFAHKWDCHLVHALNHLLHMVAPNYKIIGFYSCMEIQNQSDKALQLIIPDF